LCVTTGRIKSIKLLIIVVKNTNSPIQRLIELLTSTLSPDSGQKNVSARKQKVRQSSSDNKSLEAFDSGYPQPFKPLPNVSRLWLRNNKLDPLFAKHGLAKKLAPEMEFEARSHRIKAANRYLRIMHANLSKLLDRNQPIMFWILALRLMQKSKVLRAVALRKLDSNWFRAFKFGHVKLLLRRLDSYIFNLQEQMHIVRNYASKVKPDGSKTYRPIGNPGYADRMYLYLWQSFFVMFFYKHISMSQHAYIPGRGVATALSELSTLLRTSKYKFVYEFDLKGAFPSVIIPKACLSFETLGLPHAIASYIMTMSLKTIERVDLSPPDQYRLLDEPKFDRQASLREAAFGPMITDKSSNSFDANKGSATFMQTLQGLALFTPQEQQLPGDAVRDAAVIAAKYGPTAKQREELIAQCPWLLDLSPEDMEEEIKAQLEFEAPQWVTDQLALQEAAFPEIDLTPELGEPLEIRGFPQGSAVSPILFNTVFEVAALRGHFQALANHKDIKVLSYADDFLVFSKHDLAPQVWDASQTMREHGLNFNLEKSREICSNGEYKVENFKFLGTTFHIANGQFLLEGTPRSGARLHFDKFKMVAAFKQRDRELGKLARALNKENPPSAQSILNGWGLGELPYNLIPHEVISGQRRLDARTISAILTISEREALKANSSEDEPSEMPENDSIYSGGDGFDDGSSNQSSAPKGKGNPGSFPGDPSSVREPGLSRFQFGRLRKGEGILNKLSQRDADKLERMERSHLARLERSNTSHKASALEMLNSRISGLVINRLHGGDWQSSAAFPDRSLKSSDKADGRAWIDLKTATAQRLAPESRAFPIHELRAALDSGQTLREFLDNLSIHNASSHATVDSLRMLSNPAEFKIRKGGFKPIV
jgi:hypothetical protein